MQKNNVDQKKLYDIEYKNKKYSGNLPDYKITDSKKVCGKKILVLGAGTGRDIYYLTKNNKVYATDISDTAIEYLKKMGISCAKVDLNSKYKIKGSNYDIIIAKDILEHIDDPLSLLVTIHNLLSDSGYAVLNVPNHFFFLMRMRYIFGKNIIWKTPFIDHEKKFDEWNYMHIKFFTWNGFKKMISSANLKITKKFFDIGTLNHYTEPKMVSQYLLNESKNFQSRLVKIIDIFFPVSIRRLIANLSPNFFSGSFYVWVKKNV